MTLLAVKDLEVSFGPIEDPFKAVNGVNFTVEHGEKVGLIGESGSGKSMICLTIQGLQPAAARLAGAIEFDGHDILSADDAEMRKLRGNEMGAVFQEPMTALNPVLPIWRQLVTANLHHGKIDNKQAKQRAIELAGMVGLPNPKAIIERFPHELSGGQRQRVVIAMAISAEPSLVLADEPTTALDATVAAKVLELMARLCDELGSALILVTHDMAVASTTCDRLLVMRHGELVENGPTKQIISAPQAGYTQDLLAAARSTGLDIVGARQALRGQATDAGHPDSGEQPKSGGSSVAGAECSKPTEAS